MRAENTPTTPIYTVNVVNFKRLSLAVAPDRSIFEVTDTTTPEAAYRLGTDLVTIREMVVGRGHERLLKQLETSPTTLVESAVIRAIHAAEDPQLAADITRVYITGLVETQDFDDVVYTLLDIRASRLPLPEYNQQFMVNLHLQARELNRAGSAYRIACRMVDNSELIVPGKTNVEAWRISERQDFDLLIQQALKNPRDDIILLVYERLQHRYHAYGETPKGIAQEVAKAMIKRYLFSFYSGASREDIIQIALESKLPYKQLADINRSLSLDIGKERIKRRVGNLVDQVKDFASFLHW